MCFTGLFEANMLIGNYSMAASCPALIFDRILRADFNDKSYSNASTCYLPEEQTDGCAVYTKPAWVFDYS